MVKGWWRYGVRSNTARLEAGVADTGGVKPTGVTMAFGAALVPGLAKNCSSIWDMSGRAPDGFGRATTAGGAGGPNSSSGPITTGGFALSTRVLVTGGGGWIGMSGSTGGGGNGGNAATTAGTGGGLARRSGDGPSRGR